MARRRRRFRADGCLTRRRRTRADGAGAELGRGEHLNLRDVSRLEPLDGEGGVVDANGVDGVFGVAVGVPEHDHLGDADHLAGERRVDAYRETGGDGHVRAVALVLHARHLALEVAEVGGELGDACLRGAELRALAVAEVAAALAGSLLKLFHHRAEVRHLLLGEGERGDRVAHGGGGLLEHHLRRGRLRAERLLRAPHSLVEVFLGYLRGREGEG